ncbi:MAG: lipase family protein [Burkholderiaceae bacterium]|jgi:pimeloyl-ACP methyl ester carboxylesterase|nr:lipase family protein [Burkholderiaceae bacterium]
MKYLPLLTAFAATALLAGCGSSNSSSPPPPPPPSTGALSAAPAIVATLPAAQIDAATAASGLQAFSGTAKCDVEVVALDYTTLGPLQEQTNDSGVMLVPAGACAGAPAPLVAYARGTDFDKSRTLANPSDSETFLLIAMYAAQGYAVVATDYLGYAQSAYPYHPYLHADSEAQSVLDSVRAARAAAAQVGATLSGKVMLTGYSQGGHSAMAAQRNGERDDAAELNIVAGAYGAGPYNLTGMAQLPEAIIGYQFFVPFMITGYQNVYGNIYTDVNMVFQQPYASGIQNLLPCPDCSETSLITSGALPGGTPDQARDALVQPAFLADIASNPANPFVQDAGLNNLLDWTPVAPVLLCGGAGDPTVPPAVNRDVLMADWAARGVTNVQSVDVDAQVQAVYGPAPTDPTSAAYATYYGNYHSSYEPPFCAAAARAFFDQFK